MVRSMRKMGMMILTAAVLVSSTGCVALLVGAAAGATGYAWVRGILVKDFDVTAEQLHKAAVKGLKSLDIEPKEAEGDRLSGKIAAEFADGKDIHISVEAITERTSRIKIRVGVFGDKMRSEMVYDAVKKYL